MRLLKTATSALTSAILLQLMASALPAKAGSAEDTWGTAPREMYITRYSGHKNFSSHSTLSWEVRNGIYHDSGRAHNGTRVNACGNYLEDQQAYALNRMREEGYITNEQMLEYSKLGSSFHPSQVVFIEDTRTLPRDAILRHFGRWPSERISDVNSYHGMNSYSLRVATIYSVGGQKWKMEAPFYEPAKLPWELEPKLKPVSEKYMDRDKIKFVWEWGRLSEDGNYEASASIAANAVSNYQELLAWGGKIDEAFVQFHGLDKLRVRSFSMRHPKRRFPIDDPESPIATDKDEGLFLVPLAEALERYPAHKYSQKIRSLIEASGGALDDRKTIELLMHYELGRWDELDVHLPHIGVTPFSHGPLVLVDYSEGVILYPLGYARHLGVPEDRLSAVMNLLVRIHRTGHSPSVGQYTDVSDDGISMNPYQQHRAVEISNLNESLALKDPNYVQTILQAALAAYARKNLGWDFTQGRMLQILELMKAQKINFGISTFSPIIAAQTATLKPFATATGKNGIGPYGYVSDSELPGWMTRGQKETQSMHFFTIDQIMEMARKNPEIQARAIRAVNPGAWRARYLISTPTFF